MIIYLAARYGRRLELCGYRDQLVQLGHSVDSAWLDGLHELDPGQVPRADWGREDLDDIFLSDLVICFTENPGSQEPGAARGGRHVEFGYALGMEIPVWIVGPKENLFYMMPGLKVFTSWDECLRALSSDEKRPVHENEWGFLRQEPCRFCREQGGVFFMIDEGPEGKIGLQSMRCDKCKRTWTADSASA